MNFCNSCGASVADEAAFEDSDGYCAECDADRQQPPKQGPRVETGNADIEGSSQWDPPQGEPDRAPLPGHEHQLAGGVWQWVKDKVHAVFMTQAEHDRQQLLGLDAALVDLLHQARRMAGQCPEAYAGVERRA